MSWAKLDDHFYTHRKVVRAGVAAIGVFARGLSYAAGHETDGHLDREVAVRILADGDVTLCEQLVCVGLWERNGDGFVIHDYLRFNPSARQLRKHRKDGMLRKRRSRGRSRGGHGVTEVRHPDPVREDLGTGRDGKILSGSSISKSSEEPRRVARARMWKSVPPGEVLDDNRRAFGVTAGMTSDQVDAQWAEFLDCEFHTAHSDVDKTWRRWVREALRRAGGAVPAKRWTSPKTAGNLEAAANAIRRLQEETK